MGITVKSDEDSPFRKMLRRADAMNGKQTVVSWEDMFSDDFLLVCSSFTSLQDMFDRSGYTIKTREDFKAIPDAESDKYIAANTVFDTWAEFHKTARQTYMKKLLHSDSPLPEMTPKPPLNE